MLQNVSAEIIYCYERARQAREKAEAAPNAEAKSSYLAAEAGWLGLARSYELQQRLAKFVGEVTANKQIRPIATMARHKRVAFDPEVVAILSSAFRTVVTHLELSQTDDAVALRAAQRIIDVAAQGERDPERLKEAALAWVAKPPPHD